MIPNEILNLIAGKKLNILTLEEEIRLSDWVEESSVHEELFNHTFNSENLTKDLILLESLNVDDALDNVLAKIHIQTKSKTLWFPFKYIAVASVLLAFTIGLVLYFYSNNSIIEPGSNKAFLTLSDGTTLALREDQSELIISDSLFYSDGTSITKNGLATQEYMEIATPNGGEYSIVLSDRTKIRLNAASKLKFPRYFLDSERRVELEGEAFFEVNKNLTADNNPIPFYVVSAKQIVKVLGTVFNISAYPEDEQSLTTLVEGKVVVTPQINTQLHKELYPGQQAIVKDESEILVKSVDVESYISWTKNQFVFISEPLEKVVQKIGRWYDLDYRFEKERYKYEAIEGILPRYSSANDLLKLLEQTGQINFKIENRTIIIY